MRKRYEEVALRVYSRFIPVDWIFGPSLEIEKYVSLAIDGRIEPGMAITSGCGAGRETIYLAKKGFDVISLVFSPPTPAKHNELDVPMFVFR
jgi:hypothetical protein